MELFKKYTNDTSVDPNQDAIDLCDKNKSATKKGNIIDLSTGWQFGCLAASLVASHFALVWQWSRSAVWAHACPACYQ